MRPTPFDLVFRQSAQDVFPKIRLALDQAQQDPRDRDRFLLLRDVVTLLHELRPDGGLGEGIDRLAALLHHAYLFWNSDERTIEVPLEQLSALLASGRAPGNPEQPLAYYAVMPEHRIWAEVIPGRPPEPLDGLFVHPAPERARLRVLGVFGIHPEREGFSVVEAVGPQPLALMRSDGSELFEPTLKGGKPARLFSITGEEELLELGWRLQQLGAWSSEPRTRGLEVRITSSQLPTRSA